MSKQANTPNHWDVAVKHLSQSDPIMKKIISQYKGETLTARGDAFYSLARSIVGQQISAKAADSVWKRLEELLGKTTSKAALSKSREELRAVGLSASKANYIVEIAKFFETHGAAPDWPEDNDELVTLLTSIKGVGVWTAEMFMIFHLLKPDVLPLGDLGLLKGVGVHYGDGKNKAEKAFAEEVAKPWRPYRSVATWYLWRSLDPVPVEY